MKARHLRDNETLRDKLAAEYVLGTLRGHARRRFETWMHEEVSVRESVAHWEKRLHPLAEMTRHADPPPQVWQNIARTLELEKVALAPASQDRRSGWRESLRFWRGLGIASTLAATALTAVLLIRQPETGVLPPAYVATLTDQQARVAMLVTTDIRRRQLTVRLVAAQPPASDKSLELWALPKDGAPRSLGLVPAENTVTLALPEHVLSDDVNALAISLEPRGGSPNPNAPTGPVLYQGPWLRI